MTSQLPHSPAADRNKEPILAVLRQVLPARGRMLEIASGTGQHITWFAGALPDWTWQPSEPDAGMHPGIASRSAQAQVANVLPPLPLDVMAAEWPTAERFDAIYCANMLHIAPWAACAALMQGAARHLVPGGLLITYGPYFEQGVAPAASNLAFDASLRERDASWGIRRMEDVASEARRAGLVLDQRHALPANNLLLVFVRRSASAG